MATAVLDCIVAKLRLRYPSGYASRSEIVDFFHVLGISRDVAEQHLRNAPIPQKGLVPYSEFFQWLFSAGVLDDSPRVESLELQDNGGGEGQDHRSGLDNTSHVETLELQDKGGVETRDRRKSFGRSVTWGASIALEDGDKIHVADLFKLFDLSGDGKIQREEWVAAWDIIKKRYPEVLTRKEWRSNGFDTALFDAIPRRDLTLITREEWVKAFAKFDSDYSCCIDSGEWEATAAFAEHEGIIEECVQAAQEMPVSTEGLTGEEWSTSKFLNWLGAEQKIAERLRKQLGFDNEERMLAFCRELGRKGDQGMVLHILQNSGIVDSLAEVIWNGLVSLSQATAASGAEIRSKFAESSDSFQLVYGDLNDFYDGLEGFIGEPNPRVVEAMREEHVASEDAEEDFTPDNYHITTKSRIEWNFVVSPEHGPNEVLSVRELDSKLKSLGAEFKNAAQAEKVSYNDFLKLSEKRRAGMKVSNSWKWPEERSDVKRDRLENGRLSRKPRGLSSYSEDLRRFQKLLSEVDNDELTMPEFVAGRLYTGPMFYKYNTILRSFTNVPFMVKKCEQLCKTNRYATSLHACNSCLLKMSKVLPATTVYRGVAGAKGQLPKAFWVPNEKNVRGGIEYGFMSTTSNLEVATKYLGGASGTVFSMRLGMVDKGADLSWLSQYPHEQEICFGPLTGLEMMSTRVEGSILLVDVRLNINMSSATIEEVVSKRHNLVKDMCSRIKAEVERIVDGEAWSNFWFHFTEPGRLQAGKKGVLQIIQNQLQQIHDRPADDFNDDIVLRESLSKALQVKTDAKPTTRQLIEQAGFELLDLKQANFDLVELKRTGFSATELKHNGFGLLQLKEAGFGAMDLRQAGFSEVELKQAGFRLLELKEAGFGFMELKQAGFGAMELKQVGFNFHDLKQAGFCALELKQAGFGLQDLKQAGFDALELKKAGFGIMKLVQTGFNFLELKQAGFGALDLRQAGFGLEDVKQAGFGIPELKEAGFPLHEFKQAGFSAQELKQADVGLVQLKQLGYGALQIKQAGFRLAELKAAGFGAVELKQAGFGLMELKKADFGALELRQTGFDAQELKQAGFDLQDLKNAYFGAVELKQAGFSLPELKGAGICAMELKHAGFRSLELKRASFDLRDLKQAGFGAQELYQSGFGLRELKQEGFNPSELYHAGFSSATLKEAGFSDRDLEDD